jgi:hypothetical protein
MKTSEILNKAADLIEERGWTQQSDDNDPWGGGATGTAPVCIEGGILAAMGLGYEGNSPSGVHGELRKCPAYKAVMEHLGYTPWGNLYLYNDTPGRTAEEVIGTLREVAKIEAEKEALV